MFNRCNNCNCGDQGLTAAQTATNMTIEVPVAPLNDYDLAVINGFEGTLDEWLNRPAKNASNIVDQTQEW